MATTTTTETSTKTDSFNITVEFTGGLEMLFHNKQKHTVAVPSRAPSSEDDGPMTMKQLVPWLCENLMADSRRELFVVDGAIRPGILVLINDADWELEGEEAYEIKDGDSVLFVSTLHGG